MNKSDLIKKISENADSLNEDDLEQTVNTILNLISSSLSKGDRVEIRNFGTFSVRSRDQRISRNPKTGEKINTPEKKTIHFKMAKELFKKLNDKT